MIKGGEGGGGVYQTKPNPYSDLKKKFEFQIQLIVVMICEEITIWACLHKGLFTYGLIWSGRGKTVFVSFCLVYCKTCSSCAKTGKTNMFCIFKANWWQSAKKFINISAFFIFAINCSTQALSVGLETGECGLLEA